MWIHPTRFAESNKSIVDQLKVLRCSSYVSPLTKPTQRVWKGIVYVDIINQVAT